jgi:D-alanyl-D-alanine carboxypeptidase
VLSATMGRPRRTPLQVFTHSLKPLGFQFSPNRGTLKWEEQSHPLELVPTDESMNYLRLHLALFLIGLAGLVTLSFFNAESTSGQSVTNRSRLRKTAAVRTKPSEERSSIPALSLAATSNALLRSELSWTFGGKSQKGWYLYQPLINRLLDTKKDPGSEGFAAALSKWQQKSGIAPTGVLDADSLYAMVSKWQGERLKDRAVATPEQLVTAPTSDFYDSTRPDELRQVERNTYFAYKRMVSAAVADRSSGLAVDAKGKLASSEKYLRIISAFRSPEYQEQLRRQSPNAGRAGLAVNSPHFTGRALDLYVGGEPVETKDSNRAIQVQSPVYLWLVRNAERFGFRPYCYEPWHWEFVR